MRAKVLYFQSCTTLDTLTKERNRLAKLYHPDLGGDNAVMQEINAQFEAAKKQLAAPAPQRVWAKPQQQEPESAQDMLERFKRWADAKEQGRKEAERRAAQEQVIRQKARVREEVAWAALEMFHFRNKGGLRDCPVSHNNYFDWLYVSGNTYPYRVWLREHGFRWDPEKRHWNFYKKPQFVQTEEEDDDDDDTEYFDQ